MYVEVAAYCSMFLKKSFGFAKSRLFALMSSGSGAVAHFEEAVQDEDEFWEIGGKSSAKDILLTLTTDFLTEAPALEHLFQNYLCQIVKRLY